MLKRFLSVAVVMSVVTVGALPAFAGSHDPEEDPIVQYDDVQHLMLFSVDGMCTLTKDMDVTFEVVDDEILFGIESAPTDGSVDGCMAISVEGPNGQVNHGTVVSNLVKALKEMDLQGPLGQALKGYAKSDLGKGDMQVKVNDDEPIVTEGSITFAGDDDTVDNIKPVKGNQSDKPNKGRGHNK